jgi:glycosyltransferase involved in cell wall biosynthesis
MRILHLCPYLYPAVTFGGPAEVVFQLAKEQAKKHQVTVATSDAFSATKRISESDKIIADTSFRIIYFSNLINSIAFTEKIFSHFGLVWWIITNVQKYDIVHIHDVFILPQLLAAFVAFFFKIPIVFSPHGVVNSIRLEQKTILKKILLQTLVLPVLKLSSFWVATSKKEAQSLQRFRMSVPIATIENGIAIPDITPQDDDKKIVISYLGRLHEQKGLFELLDAINQLAPLHNQIEVAIAGPDDGILEQLQKKSRELHLSEVVKILPAKNAAQKWRFLQRTNIFVYPSYAEGFSIAILEAMSLGIPSIITTGCNFDAVASDRAGIVIRISNLASNLAQAIYKLATNPNLRNKMGLQAKRLIQLQYSIETMAQKMDQVYIAVKKPSIAEYNIFGIQIRLRSQSQLFSSLLEAKLRIANHLKTKVFSNHQLDITFSTTTKIPTTGFLYFGNGIWKNEQQVILEHTYLATQTQITATLDKDQQLSQILLYFKSNLFFYAFNLLSRGMLQKQLFQQLIKLYIEQAMYGSLCFKYGLTCLHAAAVEKKGKALVFAGLNGVGKSTLAQRLITQKGFRLLADNYVLLKNDTLFLTPDSVRLDTTTINKLELDKSDSFGFNKYTIANPEWSTQTQAQVCALFYTTRGTKWKMSSKIETNLHIQKIQQLYGESVVHSPLMLLFENMPKLTALPYQKLEIGEWKKKTK